MKINNSFINLVKLLQTLSRMLFLKAARLKKILELFDAYIRKNIICVYINTQLRYFLQKIRYTGIQILSMHIFNQ